MTKALVAICADWDKPYLDEWVQWHRSIGFEKFIVFCNNWRDKDVEVSDADGIQLVTFDGDARQVDSYNVASQYFMDEIDWALFIDIDEYLHIMSKRNLDDILAEYSQFPNLSINWRLFNSNGHEKFEGDYSVQRRFTRCHKKLDQFVKTFLNVKLCREQLRYVHWVNPHYNMQPNVNLEQEEFEGFWNYTKLDKVHELEIWHYAVKSMEEFWFRRGQTRSDTGRNRVGKELEDFKYHYEDLVEKYGMDCKDLKFEGTKITKMRGKKMPVYGANILYKTKL